jgi:phosphate:Na+ symporter
MATTLLNDSAHAYTIMNKLINVAKILWIEDLTIKQLGEDYDSEKNL